MMCVDRALTADIRPTWVGPPSNMRVRYLSHPDLRLAFIQAVEEPDTVYIVSDEPLPETLDEAVAVITKWRVDHA